MDLLRVCELCYDYKLKSGVTHALQNINYTFETDTFYAVTGRSGSGKTTLLSLLAAFDRPKSGDIFFNEESIFCNPVLHRRNNIGMVFQSYNLFPHLTVLENVMAAIDISGINCNKKDKKELAIDALRRAQVDEKQFLKFPGTLSGGEQQRTAIARAIVGNHKVILADEPTGNLDNSNSEKIVLLFSEMVHTYHKCVIMVTHSLDIAKQADKLLVMSDGEIIE